MNSVSSHQRQKCVSGSEFLLTGEDGRFDELLMRTESSPRSNVSMIRISPPEPGFSSSVGLRGARCQRASLCPLNPVTGRGGAGAVGGQYCSRKCHYCGTASVTELCMEVTSYKAATKP